MVGDVGFVQGTVVGLGVGHEKGVKLNLVVGLVVGDGVIFGLGDDACWIG